MGNSGRSHRKNDSLIRIGRTISNRQILMAGQAVHAILYENLSGFALQSLDKLRLRYVHCNLEKSFRVYYTRMRGILVRKDMNYD